MTHRVDCSVRDEYRDQVNEIATEFWNGNHVKAKGMTRDLGWDMVGGGAGRKVFRVTPDYQQGEVEGPTHEAPCVVKFATKHARYNGKQQNSQEVSQFQSLPEELTEGHNPVFVPIKDWAPDDSWVSMPLVDADGGTTGAVDRRLAEAGWQCHDMHRDNVGEMHTESVVLDYGLECIEQAAAIEIAEELADEFERVDHEAEAFDDGDGDAHMGFTPPPDVLPDIPEHDKTSAVYVSPEGGINMFSLYFGGYDPEIAQGFHPPLIEIAEDVVDEAAWLGANSNPWERQYDGKEFIEFEVRIEARGPDERFTPDLAYDLYDDFEREVRDRFPGGSDADEKAPTPIDPEVGMVLDHPDYLNTVVVKEVHDDGTVVWEDTSGYDYTIDPDSHELPVTDDMVVRLPKTTIDTAQERISQAVERAIDEGAIDTDRVVRSDIDGVIDQAVADALSPIGDD